MSFLNFMFYPLVIATIIAVIIEQILRRGENETSIFISMRIRKFLWRQAWIVNVLWFIGYAIAIVVMGRQAPQVPDMIWEGGIT